MDRAALDGDRVPARPHRVRRLGVGRDDQLRHLGPGVHRARDADQRDRDDRRGRAAGRRHPGRAAGVDPQARPRPVQRHRRPVPGRRPHRDLVVVPAERRRVDGRRGGRQGAALRRHRARRLDGGDPGVPRRQRRGSLLRRQRVHRDPLPHPRQRLQRRRARRQGRGQRRHRRDPVAPLRRRPRRRGWSLPRDRHADPGLDDGDAPVRRPRPADLGRHREPDEHRDRQAPGDRLGRLEHGVELRDRRPGPACRSCSGSTRPRSPTSPA